MAIKKEYYTNESGKDLIKQYSDRRMLIERDGVEYMEAIDPIEFAEERVYEETAIPIEE